MTLDNRIYRDNFAQYRDPQNASVGYHFGDDFGFVPCRFKWFDSVNDLIDHILNVELPLCGYDSKEHEDYYGRVEQALAGIAAEGLTENSRESLNQVDWGFTMHWWGTLDDLISGKTQFSREILGSYAVSKGNGHGIPVKEMSSFVRFTRHCCRSTDNPHVPLSTTPGQFRPT